MFVTVGRPFFLAKRTGPTTLRNHEVLQGNLDEAGVLPDRLAEKVDAAELAIVLSHYDLGAIESITDFPRGSRRSPKVGIVCERGKFLLKRQAAERANLDRVRFAHDLQAHLQARGFPIAKLVETRTGRGAIVQWREHLYELFEFIPGQPFPRNEAAADDAGRCLAKFHEAVRDWSLPASLVVPRGDYHDAAGVRTGLCSIGSNLRLHDSFAGDEAELAGLLQYLLEAYESSAKSVDEHGFRSFPEGTVHSDWHPGNLLFRRQKVVAVVDYDSARLASLVTDVANGALQFSMMAGGDPHGWPPEVDEVRFRAFLAGYLSTESLRAEERACIPDLMVEALIAECVPPIARTGSVGRWSGLRVLRMIRRKAAWLLSNRNRLLDAL